VLVQHHTYVPASCLHLLSDVTNAVAQATTRDIAPCYVTDGWDGYLCSLKGKAVGRPIGLARDVIVDPGDPQTFEPPRGSWTYVSLVVVAVHDNRLILPKPSSRPGI